MMLSLSNNTSTEVSILQNAEEETLATFNIIRLLVDLLILGFSLFGNILIISSIWKMRKLRKVFTSVLIVNLAVCDIALVLFSIPPDIIRFYRYSQYPFRTFGCKFFSPLATCQVNAISFIMTLIAVERYVTIKYNFRSSAGTIKKSLVTITLHAISLATVVPYMFHSAVETDETGAPQCIELWGDKAGKAYTVFLFLVQIGIPLPVMVILYMLSWRIIEKRNSKTISFVDNITLTSYPNFVKYLCCCFFKANMAFRQCRDNRSELKKKLSIASEVSIVRQKQTKYYLKMFTGVVVLFTICMLPNQITWFYLTFEPIPLNPYLEVAFYWLTYANAVCNPWIYAGCNPAFKRAYRSFIKKCLSVCFKKKETRDSIPRDRKTTIFHQPDRDMVQDTTAGNYGGDFLWLTPWSMQDKQIKPVIPRSVSDYELNVDPYDPFDPVYTEKKKPRVKKISRRISADSAFRKNKDKDKDTTGILPWQRKASQSYSMVLNYVDQQNQPDKKKIQRNFSEADINSNFLDPSSAKTKTRRVGVCYPSNREMNKSPDERMVEDFEESLTIPSPPPEILISSLTTPSSPDVVTEDFEESLTIPSSPPEICISQIEPEEETVQVKSKEEEEGRKVVANGYLDTKEESKKIVANGYLDSKEEGEKVVVNGYLESSTNMSVDLKRLSRRSFDMLSETLC